MGGIVKLSRVTIINYLFKIKERNFIIGLTLTTDE